MLRLFRVKTTEEFTTARAKAVRQNACDTTKMFPRAVRQIIKTCNL